MVIRRGEIWWAELESPNGSAAGYHRPVLVLQNDRLNASGLYTTIGVPLTSVMTHRGAPGNVHLASGLGGLNKPSLAVTTLLDTLDKSELAKRMGLLDDESIGRVEDAILLTLAIDR